MGFMNWLMKGVDQVDEDSVECDEASLQELKEMSNMEKQEESATLDDLKRNSIQQNNKSMEAINNSQIPNNYEQSANQSINYQAYQNVAPNNQFMNNGYNLGQSMNTTQNVFMQQAPNQPFAPVTITIFQISNEDDIKLSLKHLGKKSPCAISFSKMPRRKFNELYQFLSGGVFALGAKIVKWNDNYILTPRGMEISKQDRVKK